MPNGKGGRILNRGKLIVLEGPDGCGKTTLQLGFLKPWLEELNIPVFCTHEPSCGPIGLEIRRDIANSISDSRKRISPGKLQLKFVRDSLWHEKNVLLPKMEEGFVVLCDRRRLSSITCGYSDGLNINWLIRINSKPLLPHLTLYLRTDVKNCLIRLRMKETDDRFEKKEFLEKIIETYEHLLETDIAIKHNIKVIDGNKSLEDVFEQAKNIIVKRLV